MKKAKSLVKYRLIDFTRGWIVGDFEPAILRLNTFEFMVRFYKKGEKESKHVHKKADEISVVVSGKFRMNGKNLKPGDIIHLAPGVPADFKCLADGATAVVKTPSIMGDKYLVK